jgi:hypothetical protein
VPIHREVKAVPLLAVVLALTVASAADGQPIVVDAVIMNPCSFA